MQEAVEHPKHYNSYPIEVIDMMLSIWGKENTINFCLMNAFKYGAPPHAGLAYGLDRVAMLLTASDTIRDVIAFPKVKDASDLMVGAPAEVEQKQLDELNLILRNEEEKKADNE